MDSRLWGAAARTKSFFEAFLCAPVVVLFYLGYKVVGKTKVMRARDIDLVTGRRELNLKELIAEEELERSTWPKWKKAYKIFC